MKITFTVAQIGMTKYDNQLQLYFKIWGGIRGVKELKTSLFPESKFRLYL